MVERKKPGDESAHDVLAAEEFAMPAPDPSLHHGPVTLPDDPTGIAEPVGPGQRSAYTGRRGLSQSHRRRSCLCGHPPECYYPLISCKQLTKVKT